MALGTASALGLARFAYGLVLPAMRAQPHWTLAEAGALTTANALGYLGGAAATPLIARRLATASMFRLGMALTAASLAATAMTGDSWILLAARAVAGVSGALVFIAGGVAASQLAAEARSPAPLNVYYGGAGAAVALSGASLPHLLAGHAERWPLAWAGLAAAAALATIVSWTAAPAERRHPGSATAPDKAAALWPLASAYLLFGAGYIAYITFLSAYLASRQAGVGEVTLTWALIGISVMASPLLWHRPLATWAGSRPLAALLAILAASAALPLLSSAPPLVIASAIAYGSSFMLVPSAITALLRRSIAPPAFTRALGFFTTLFAAGQTLGPWLSGSLADHAGTDAILAWTSGLCAAAALLAMAQRTGTAQ